ncbi:MAG: hypothetical protein ATN36_05265 [Epulopiscium sp. Nele67-Bin005]|nr:MAG: hypothetical protein ATN36_05265 [Epulopiscium sp. Nele67-Bin005]
MEFLRLVGKSNPLPKTYSPDFLIQNPITKIWLVDEVDTQFYKMNMALQKEGLSGLHLVSGYRSYGHQQTLYTKKLKRLYVLTGMYDAHEIIKIMPAGCSEHQLGLAIDVTTVILKTADDPYKNFQKTFHFEWLMQRSIDFGFILRYPIDKEHITLREHKSYHFRYVGVNHAKKMYKFNLCLEEYLLHHNAMRCY